MKTGKRRVTKAVLANRFYRRAMKGIRFMRHRHRIAGVSMRFLHEHNVPDAQVDRYVGAAESVGKRLEAEGWYVSVDARDIEQLGGQHMECITHVEIIVRKKAPPEFGGRNEYLPEF